MPEVFDLRRIGYVMLLTVLLIIREPAAEVAWGDEAAAAWAEQASFATVVHDVQPRIVKIYGAGGIRGLEAYQSGFAISPQGHILTVWSYVLDTDFLVAILGDGRRYEAKLVGMDPRTEIAIIKVEAEDVPYFDLRQARTVEPGARILAFSNLFNVATGDEAASVLHGCVAAIAPLHARRGAYETPYQGTALILDAMTNNPGAAGGALTDREGHLVGLLGKELRNALTNTWLNYALPIDALQPSIDDILAGRSPSAAPPRDVAKPKDPVTLELLGLTLVPDVLPKTPPFVDGVRPGSPADKAGIRPDDLVLFVNERIAASCKSLREEVSYIDRIDEVRLTVQREQELLEFTLHVE